MERSAGRYSVQEIPVEYVDPRHSSAPAAAAATLIESDGVALLSHWLDDELAERARRSTPKARPGQARPVRGARSDVVAPRGERPQAGVARRGITPNDSPVRQARAGLSSDAPVAQAIAPSIPASSSRTSHPGPDPRSRDREPTGRSRLTTKPSTRRRGAAERKAALEGEPLTAVHARPPQREVARIARPAEASAARELPKVVVDPSLAARAPDAFESASALVSQPPRAQVAAASSRPSAPAAKPSTYTPLPSDRRGYEAFLREHEKDPELARIASWAEPETQLIARDSFLRPRAPLRAALQMRLSRPLLSALAGACVAAGIVFLLLRERPPVNASAVDDAARAAVSAPQAVAATSGRSTLIVTEPSGAEIVLGGAVMGNTPAEVSRPVDGEELYLLRLSGFQSQLVRVSDKSRDAIVVSLTPVGLNAPRESAAASTP